MTATSLTGHLRTHTARQNSVRSSDGDDEVQDNPPPWLQVIDIDQRNPAALNPTTLDVAYGSKWEELNVSKSGPL
jgi:hypothetical protein